MAMEVMNSYGSYATQYMAGNSTASGTKKKDTEQTAETANSSKSKSTADYASELAKLVPSVDFGVGSSVSSAKSGKTLTINPQLLKKMQNDPAQEKETKELIRGVESAMNLIDSITKASGWTCVYKHSYIDENGKYHSVGHYRNDFMINMSDKLREERRVNSEKLIEKAKEKAAKREEELKESLEEKEVEKGEESTAYNKAEQILKEKMADSKDGTIYLYDTDIKPIIEAIKEDETGKAAAKKQTQVGSNLDLQV